jgi:hypothetical protein
LTASPCSDTLIWPRIDTACQSATVRPIDARFVLDDCMEGNEHEASSSQPTLAHSLRLLPSLLVRRSHPSLAHSLRLLPSLLVRRYYQGIVSGHTGKSFAHVAIDADGAMMGFFDVDKET